jgi:hypothetical protein
MVSCREINTKLLYKATATTARSTSDIATRCSSGSATTHNNNISQSC